MGTSPLDARGVTYPVHPCHDRNHTWVFWDSKIKINIYIPGNNNAYFAILHALLRRRLSLASPRGIKVEPEHLRYNKRNAVILLQQVRVVKSHRYLLHCSALLVSHHHRNEKHAVQTDRRAESYPRSSAGPCNHTCSTTLPALHIPTPSRHIRQSIGGQS